MSLEHSQSDSGDSRSRQLDEVNRRKQLCRKRKRKKGADASRKKLNRKQKRKKEAHATKMKLKRKNDKLVDPYVTLTEEEKKAIVDASLEHTSNLTVEYVLDTVIISSTDIDQNLKSTTLITSLLNSI